MPEVSPRFLRWWPTGHATSILAGSLISIATATLLPMLVVAVASFGWLGYQESQRSSLSRLVDAANTLTVGRLVGVLILAALAEYSDILQGPFLGGIIIGFLLALDGLDGWVARKHSGESRFGGLLDEEVDAFFLLITCHIAVFLERIDLWILAAGWLRYLFLLGTGTVQYPDTRDIRSRRGQIVYLIMMLTMTTIFLPYPVLYVPLVAAATVFLVWSFAYDVYSMVFGPRRAHSSGDD